MGETLVEKLHELQSLSEDVHLFCPRDARDPNGLFLDEDLYGMLDDESENDKRHRLRALDKAEERKQLVLQCLRIFAFNGADAVPYQEWLKGRLNATMTSCDICIRMYHRSRPELKHGLEEDYDSDEVAEFMRVFDDMNLERITAGLDHADDKLRSAPPESRGIASLDSQGMYALFESLSCEALLKNEALLQKHFDEPFKLVQTRKRLRLGNYLPAMSRFIFSPNEDRYVWAFTMFTKFKRGLTKAEFAGSVRDPLFDAMKRVQLTNLEADFLSPFWGGVKIIVDKLDKELITQSLRAIDIDICMLALEHLRFEFSGFKDLIGTIQQLLDKSPVDFWDAMGAISPVTVIEQILNNKTLDQVLLQANEETSDQSLKEAFGWIDSFFGSIKPSNQTPACRSLVNQLLRRFQEDRYSRASRSFCYKLGFQVLVQTLTKLNEGKTRSTFVGAATVHDLLEFISLHIGVVLSTIKTGSPEEVDLSLGIIEKALALDCLSLDIDREILARDEHLQHDLNAISPIWDAVTKAVASDDVALPTKALAGAAPLVGTEKFVVKNGAQMSKGRHWYNNTLYSFSKSVGSILEKIAEFTPEELDKLFEARDASHAVIVHLFASEAEPRQAAIEILKSVSSQDSRRDALGHIIKSFYINALDSMSKTLRRISKRKVFAPCQSMLKVCSDVVDVLCSPQDGVLRERSLSIEEANTTEFLWQSLWHALMTIFEMMEKWSNVGHEKTLMMDFCRDTMQFADRLFDEYSHFASALNQARGGADKSLDTGTVLLKYPQQTMYHMVIWLRLRDEYLIGKAVDLTTKLLKRLQDVSMEVTDQTRLFMQEVLSDKTKTKLSLSQKAELSRALEDNLGISITKVEKKPAKQGTLAGWAKSGSGHVSTASPDTDDSDSLSKVIADSSRGAEAYRARIQAAQQQKERAVAARKAESEKNMSEFRRQRELEKEAKKRRDLEAIAKAKKNLPLMGVAAQTAEAGSGLRGIGISGKDHTVKGEGVMVSSDESDDDDDEIDEELFGPSKEKKAPKPKLPLMPQGPVKKKRLVRSFKDMRARLAPDLGPLHRTILGWDYFHDGDFPPNSRTDIYTAVPNRFMTPNDYQNTFQPLLTLEAWQGFVKAREEGTFKSYEVKVINRSSVDAFLELSTQLSHADNKEIQLSEGDICLLSKSSSPGTAAEAPHCLARVYRIGRKKAHIEVLYRIIPGNPLVSSLVPNATVHGIKIQSITPLEREYGALAGLQYYDLCDEIIKAKPSPLLNYTDKQLESLSTCYNLNNAQTKAVKSAIDNDAFTLIQGPPGSGKTKTIVAIVGALLTDSLKNNQGTVIAKPAMAAGANRTLPTPKKLLVCAPSNAAVDELVMRFKEGVKTTSGQHKKISVVRLGRSDAMNVNVKDVTLDELVNAKLNTYPGQNGNQREETQNLMKEHQMVSEKLREARDKLDAGTAKGQAAIELKNEFDTLRRRKTQLSMQIDNAKDSEATMNRQADLNRKRAQQSVLDEAHVICATLSGSGHEMFQNLNIEFETVVVDEAAQCVEMSALIPLKYGCSKAILVGDPKQLPPTVFSKEAARFQYEQSLFVRMQNNHPKDIHLLDTQYRMHPEISYFPSQTFYDGKLLDGDNMGGLRQQPWHASAILGPYRFFDVQGQHQAAPKGHSLINLAEIEVAMQLFKRLMSDFRDYDFKNKVGIITPYKSQLRELKMRFARSFGESITDIIEFNTTDAYQGRESEIIIFSCVRASPAGGIGFLQDIRRMNVGLTRAKSSLWVLGNSQSLIRGEFWRKLVEDAQKRERYTQGNLMQMLQKHSSSFPAPKYLKGVKPKSASGDVKMEDVKTEVKAEDVKTEVKAEDVVKMEGAVKTENAFGNVAQTGIKKEKNALPTGDWDDFYDAEPANEDVEMKDYQSETSSANTPKGEMSNERPSSRPGSKGGSEVRPSASSAGAARPKAGPAKRKQQTDPFIRRSAQPKKPRNA
ncbi:uncharacterized protein K452DRAFT_322283 [Aplosporella prunicola CBS 121167]|uniref:UvrD-like helicase ATP-binding domain-containing protein n=1 Tax=Aplosporella prunicola CBS 121167 TaxID=1176127 RepID=A0A6A6B075_9PEZI|nr:uncharacterized protein K452DRAFT_322283 [Aplosporella prunicola CBS 121167]KAF2136625.1 hypothetical protein K452DRAFT_322283 [Aplosporella prunicola CBS 121167]